MMNQSLQYSQARKTRAVQLEKMYLSEPGNWPNIYENTDAIPR